MSWYVAALKKYAVFSGRSQRIEYWMFTLINFIISIVLGFIVGLAGGAGSIGTIYFLAVLIPSRAVGIRRLHDTGRSAWWLLILLVPLIGPIVLLVFLVKDSDPGENRYGPNPEAAVA